MLTARKSFKIIISFIVVIFFISPVFAEDSSEINKWRGGPHIGISLYTGVIGAEIQKGHYGVTLGIPSTIGLKYYSEEKGYGWFFGMHAMKYSIDDKETVDNIPYDSKTVTIYGLGFGYRWRFYNHLDLTTSLSPSYFSKKLTGEFAKRTENSLMIYPGITIGYTF